MTSFSDRLAAAVQRTNTPTLVGLDPRADQLPPGLLGADERDDPAAVARAFQQFSCAIIDVVAPLVAAVKPQAAFFEQCGPHGLTALAAVIQHARQKQLLVILDGKRNDIGSTAQAYAEAYVGAESVWGSDALTVSPYLGDDSLDPFVQASRDHSGGVFVLVKTSNPGGTFLQDLQVEGKTIYRRMAEHVEALAAASVGDCGYGDIGAVVGATYPEQLKELRDVMPHAWLLVPGFGAQGGGAEDVLPAVDNKGLGAIVNSSRAIIFAHQRPEFKHLDWQRAVEAATQQMIEALRTGP